jgi:succinate dehydrogenase/fumarate reductase-like Fe-S protein
MKTQRGQGYRYDVIRRSQILTILLDIQRTAKHTESAARRCRSQFFVGVDPAIHIG